MRKKLKKANEDLVILSFKRLDSEGCTNSPISVSPPLKGCDAEPQSSITELESALKQPAGRNSQDSEHLSFEDRAFKDVDNDEEGEVEVDEEMGNEERAEVELRLPGDSTSTLSIGGNSEKAKKGEAFEETTNLGLVFNILKLCLTQRQAAFGVIFFAFILNASDAFSDYSLAFYLYNTGFLTAASTILLIDYGVFFISLSHYLMSHLATATWLTLVFNSLFLVLLHPFTPGLSALYWFIVRARGLKKEDTAHYFLKMTSVIQGCAEAPSQIVATSWMILTHQLEAPWTKQSEVCDSWGNCIALGVFLSVGSLGLSWVSLLKASLDSFQSADVLSAVCLLLPSLVFRLASTILLFTYLEVKGKLRVQNLRLSVDSQTTPRPPWLSTILYFFVSGMGNIKTKIQICITKIIWLGIGQLT